MSFLVNKIIKNNNKNISSLTKQILNLSIKQTKSIHTSSLNLIKITAPVSAEPTKAKKRVDPAVLAIQ